MKTVVGRTVLIVLLVMGVGLSGVLTKTAAAGPVIEFGDESFLKIDFQTQIYGVWRDTGSGPNDDDDTLDANFRRNRLSFRGQATDTVGFVMQLEHNGSARVGTLGVGNSPSGDDIRVLDAFVSYSPSPAFQLRVGKSKQILQREVLENCFQPLSVDRSLFLHVMDDNSRTTRDYGVTAFGNLFDDRFQYRLSVSEGLEGGRNTPSDSFRYIARVHYSAFDKETSFGYKSTYLGEKKVLTVGASYGFEPDPVYADTVGQTDKKDWQAWSVDVFAEWPTSAGTFTGEYAYTDSDFDDAYKGASPDSRTTGLRGEKNGSYAKAGYLLPNGMFQIFGRWEDWSFANLDGTVDEQITFWAGGVNYYIWGQDLRLTLEYSTTDFDREENHEDFNTLVLMFQARI